MATAGGAAGAAESGAGASSFAGVSNPAVVRGAGGDAAFRRTRRSGGYGGGSSEDGVLSRMFADESRAQKWIVFCICGQLCAILAMFILFLALVMVNAQRIGSLKEDVEVLISAVKGADNQQEMLVKTKTMRFEKQDSSIEFYNDEFNSISESGDHLLIGKEGPLGRRRVGIFMSQPECEVDMRGDLCVRQTLTSGGKRAGDGAGGGTLRLYGGLHLMDQSTDGTPLDVGYVVKQLMSGYEILLQQAPGVPGSKKKRSLEMFRRFKSNVTETDV